MTARNTTKPRAIKRASVGNSYIRRDRAAWKVSGTPEKSTHERLCSAWFDYHVRRAVDRFILSGAHDKKALAGCLNAIVQAAFHILLARNGAEVAAARNIHSTGVVRRARLWDTNGRGARLATARRCELGRSMILGDAAAEQVARFELTVEMSVFQIHRLRARPDVVDEILAAFEPAVPLNLDYRLYLAAHADERAFRLAGNSQSSKTKKPAGSDSGPGRFPLLGITTALGAETR
jgi:hypothetical protein